MVDFWGLSGGSSSFGTGDPSSTSSTPAVNSFSSQGGIGAGLGLAGLGLDIFGTLQGMNAAEQSAQAGEKIAGLEEQVNAQRQLAMQVTARRQQMETIRQNQRAKASATAAAVNQGGQFGSGLAGGLAQIAGQSGSNLLGEDQQLTIGNKIFGLDAQISQQKMAMYEAQSNEATSAGWQSLGGALLKSAPMLAGLALG